MCVVVCESVNESVSVWDRCECGGLTVVDSLSSTICAHTHINRCNGHKREPPYYSLTCDWTTFAFVCCYLFCPTLSSCPLPLCLLLCFYAFSSLCCDICAEVPCMPSPRVRYLTRLVGAVWTSLCARARARARVCVCVTLTSAPNALSAFLSRWFVLRSAVTSSSRLRSCNAFQLRESHRRRYSACVHTHRHTHTHTAPGEACTHSCARYAASLVHRKRWRAPQLVLVDNAHTHTHTHTHTHGLT